MKNALMSLVCLCVLLFAGSAFAADPFEVHEGGFGPKIKGLQLGMPMTWTEMAVWLLQNGRSEFVVSFSGSASDVRLIFKGEGEKITGWDFGYSESEDIKKKFAGKNFPLEELFEELRKDGYTSASYLSYDGAVSVNDNRLSRFELSKGRDFDAESKPIGDFAQELAAAYSLGTLEDNHDNSWSSSNPAEGWEVRISEISGGIVSVYPIPE
jgi:hypothetical protein